MRQGDFFTWNDSVLIEVIEIADDESWALIACQAYGEMGPGGSVWTKTQALPFPASFIPKEEE